MISSPVSRKVPMTNRREAVPERVTWRRSASVGAPAQWRSSITTTVGQRRAASARMASTALNKRYRSVSGSADGARCNPGTMRSSCGTTSDTSDSSSRNEAAASGGIARTMCSSTCTHGW